MAGTEYRAKDKIVSKMTREGLTEENIREGSVKEISQRSRGHPAERKKRYAPLRHSNDDNDGDRVENRLEQEPHSEGEGSSVGEKILREKKERKTKAAQKFSEKLRDQESVPEESLEGHKSSIQNKQKKVRLMKEEAKAGKLSFEDEGNSMIRGAGMYIGKKMVGGAAEAASSYVKEEVRKEDEENPAVESVRAGGLAAERTTSVLKETQKRSMRSDVRASRRGYRSDSGRAERFHFHTEENAGSQAASASWKKERQSFLNRFFQKNRYKEAYRAARSGASAGKLGGAAAAGGIENMTVKAKIVMKDLIRRNHAVLIGFGIFGLLFLLIAIAFSSCSATVQGGGSVIGITTYPSSDEDIYAAENAYLELEHALNSQINNMESEHPGYDEYQYNVSEITHNPYHLISYLTAKYGDWTYQIVSAIINIFCL